MDTSPATRLLHANDHPEEGAPIVEPIFSTSLYRMAGAPEDAERFYGRYHSPNWTALETALGGLEDASAVAFASGLGAAHALILALGERAKRFVVARDSYFGARKLLDAMRPFGVEAVPVDCADHDAVRAALAGAPSVLWVETPSNPYLIVFDLAALGELAAAAGAPMVVDNTTATAVLQRPLDLGATACLVSLTKATSGHSDVVLGAVTSRDRALVEQLEGWRIAAGAIPGPFETWLAHRGLRTLPLRIARQSATAALVARYLAEHPRVTAVHYPGLDPRTAELAHRQMPDGCGPLLSFEVAGGAAAADALVRASRLFVAATSFGGVESSWERRARWASETAAEGLVRASCGIEEPDDLVADLEQALASLGG